MPDLRQVAAGKIDDEVGVHGPIKARSESVRNHPMGWAQYRSGPLLMVVDNLALSQTRKKRVLWFMPAVFFIRHIATEARHRHERGAARYTVTSTTMA